MEEYDESVEDIKSVNNKLDDYLKSQKKLLQSSQVGGANGILSLRVYWWF